MNPAKPCDTFIDEITSRGKPSAALQAHLEQCPRCREVRASVETLREVPSVFPEALVQHFEQKALEGLAGAAATTSALSTSPLSTPAISGPAWLLAFGGLLVVGGTLTWLALFRSPAAPTVAPAATSPAPIAAFIASASATPTAVQKPPAAPASPASILSSEDENAKP